ncbi:pectinesterase inhibitor 4-like [Nicotiana tabacum]|uniref:21 kDa protein-like n=2 Tax=Nicotiana TaxID=4085 RepID=A0A1S4CML1_TOBAC|nr:PREDICTED: 21 kDa protein-like [Nicotiana sylvestris]XP_016502507.1 PREDICTED: 21 kDa protein-like [Nicotiana tabacum]
MEVYSTCKSMMLPLLAIVLFISLTQPAATAAKVSRPAYTNFVKTKCNITTYPSLCQKTLIPYASSVKINSTRLCKAALNVAISGARSATVAVSGLKKKKGITKTEAAAIKDCFEDVKDAIYELKLAVDAMGHLGDKDKEFQLANAKTYASAVITDADSCTEGFSGRKVNPAVKKIVNSCMANITKLASNALALINHLY